MSVSGEVELVFDEQLRGILYEHAGSVFYIACMSESDILFELEIEGNEVDEREPKRQSRAAQKARSEHEAMVVTGDMAGEGETSTDLAEYSSMSSSVDYQSTMPESFGDFSNCRIILDCIEFRLSAPRKDLEAANLVYSNYKHNLTAKYLIGVAPNGKITFVSEAGDLILADKGFLLHDILPQGVSLNLPAFLSGKERFTKAEAIL
eukprot:gene9847-18427_t